VIAVRVAAARAGAVVAEAPAAPAGTGAADVRRRGLAGLALLSAAAAAAVVAAPAGPTVEVKVSHRGFEPSRIVVRRGETTRLVLSSEAGEHCFAIDALRVEKRVASGRPTRLELTPERASSFPFYCCLETGKQAERERGELVVSE
jgi:heme/copper-type cytochrome/quinol oxidase subunit 2